MYSSFKSLKATELTLIRRTLFFPWYELTDGQNLYGKLVYKGFFRRNVTIETATNIYNVDREGFFSRTLLISTNGNLIGKLKMGFFSSASLIMNDGFEAEFEHDSLLSRTFVWKTSRFGEMMRLKHVIFGFNRQLALTIDPTMANIDMMPLLAFLGSHLLILRRRRQQAAASH